MFDKINMGSFQSEKITRSAPSFAPAPGNPDSKYPSCRCLADRAFIEDQDTGISEPVPRQSVGNLGLRKGGGGKRGCWGQKAFLCGPVMTKL